MKLIKKVFFESSSLYAPVRGRVLNGKWEKILQQQKSQNQQWKKISELSGQENMKVPVVEAFRDYIHENPLVKMYLQTGLDSIP
jgi:hypothetical protein